MKKFSVFNFVLVFSILSEIYCDEEFVFKYDGMDQQESLKDYFDIALDDIKMKEGSDSIFIVSGNIDQKIELDDNWKAEIRVHRSDTADGEYTEYLKFPGMGACAFMKTIFQKYFYPSLKDCANVPSPDTCPIPKTMYKSNCEFDANVFKKVAKPGCYKVIANLMNDGEVKTGVTIRGCVEKK